MPTAQGSTCTACGETHTGCIECTVDACVKCDDKSLLKGSACEACSTSVTNCESCRKNAQGAVLCSICKPGYTPNAAGDTCNDCSAYANCAECSDAACTVCAPGFVEGTDASGKAACVSCTI